MEIANMLRTRVLLIEDNPGDAHLIRKMLNTANTSEAFTGGFDLIHAECLTGGLELLRNEQFTIILLDLGLPESKGLDTLAGLRSQVSDIPIIVLTGLNDEQAGIEAVQAGAQDFLIKGQVNDILLIRSLFHSIDRHRMMKELARSNAQLKELLSEMQQDLDAAAQIQRSLLPDSALEFPGIDTAWSFRPCGAVGGDLFNIFPFDASHIGFYILDVTGHGVPAALLSVTLSRMLTNWGSGDNLLVTPGGAIRSPAEVLSLLNTRFHITIQNSQYFTMIYGVLDIENRVLQYARAGHQPILVSTTDSEIQVWEEGNRPVGWHTESDFQEFIKPLASGTRLFMYTDGLIEAKRPDQEDRFGQHKLIDLIKEGRSRALKPCVNGVIDHFDSWIGDSQIQDDIALLAVEIK